MAKRNKCLQATFEVLAGVDVLCFVGVFVLATIGLMRGENIVPLAFMGAVLFWGLLGLLRVARIYDLRWQRNIKLLED